MYRKYIFYFPIANVVVCERSKDETKQLLGCEDGSLVRLLQIKLEMPSSSFLISCGVAMLQGIKNLKWEQGSCKSCEGYQELDQYLTQVMECLFLSLRFCTLLKEQCKPQRHSLCVCV